MNVYIMNHTSNISNECVSCVMDLDTESRIREPTSIFRLASFIYFHTNALRKGPELISPPPPHWLWVKLQTTMDTVGNQPKKKKCEFKPWRRQQDTTPLHFPRTHGNSQVTRERNMQSHDSLHHGATWYFLSIISSYIILFLFFFLDEALSTVINC